MTKHTYYVCDSCGEEFKSDDNLRVKYERMIDENLAVVRKRHFCEECGVPEGYKWEDKHPAQR